MNTSNVSCSLPRSRYLRRATALGLVPFLALGFARAAHAFDTTQVTGQTADTAARQSGRDLLHHEHLRRQRVRVGRLQRRHRRGADLRPVRPSGPRGASRLLRGSDVVVSYGGLVGTGTVDPPSLPDARFTRVGRGVGRPCDRQSNRQTRGVRVRRNAGDPARQVHRRLEPERHTRDPSGTNHTSTNGTAPSPISGGCDHQPRSMDGGQTFAIVDCVRDTRGHQGPTTIYGALLRWLLHGRHQGVRGRKRLQRVRCVHRHRDLSTGRVDDGRRGEHRRPSLPARFDGHGQRGAACTRRGARRDPGRTCAWPLQDPTLREMSARDRPAGFITFSDNLGFTLADLEVNITRTCAANADPRR